MPSQRRNHSERRRRAARVKHQPIQRYAPDLTDYLLCELGANELNVTQSILCERIKSNGVSCQPGFIGTTDTLCGVLELCAARFACSAGLAQSSQSRTDQGIRTVAFPP